MKKVLSVFFISCCVIFYAFMQGQDSQNTSKKQNQKGSIVALDPASIEILYMIGAEDEILAVPDMKNIKPVDKTAKLEKVGTFTNPNLEKILSLKPKVVIITSYSVGLKSSLEKYKVKTIELPANSLKDIQNNIITLGEMTGHQSEANKIASDFESKIENLKADPIGRSGVFIYSSTPLMVFGGDTLPSDVLEVIGVKNIAKDIVGQKPILDAEYLLGKNPDIIFYGLRVKNENELVDSNALFKNLKAVKSKNVYFLELHALLRGSPSIIDKIVEIKNQLKDLKK